MAILRIIEPWYCRWDRWRTRRWFLRNAKRYPFANPQPGFTIVASLENPVSLNKVMRDLAFRLKEAGIPFQTFSTSARRLIPAEDVEPILTPRNEFRSRLYDHVIEMSDSAFPAEELGVKRLTVSFWEFASGYLEHRPEMADKRHLVAMSDFTHAYFRRVLPKTAEVIKLLYPFRLPTNIDFDAAEIRQRFNIPANAFAVFFNFDYGSGFHRKSPYLVVEAFAKAFAHDENVVLVMKTMQAAAHADKRQELTLLITKLGIANKCVFVDDYVSAKALYALTAACDAYMSMHRGEGFGLGIAEAMSLAKPVIVTNYSANTEFCNTDNALLIPYQLVQPLPEQNDVPYYKYVTGWAEPDVDAAANALRELYENPSKRKTLGENARLFMNDYFSVANFRKSVEAIIGIGNAR